MSADELIHYWSAQDTDLSACGVDIFHTPYTYGSPEWHQVTCADCLAKRPATGPTVPNWIGRAVVLYADSVVPVTSWRATKTQVIVTEKSGRERRFYLDGLREVGSGRSSPFDARVILAPADDSRALKLARRRKLDAARSEVLGAVERMRLQDSTDDLAAVISKLEIIRMTATKALASLADES